MPVITVRDLEDDVINTLKARAREHDRSLEAEIREILRREAGSRRVSVEELLTLVDKIAALTPDVAQTDSADILRELRDGRY
jgi:antitoxin FitA